MSRSRGVGARRVCACPPVAVLGAVASVVALAAAGCGGSSNSVIEGSGVPAAQARDVAAFDSVELAGSNNVVIHVGEKQSVVVKGDDNLLDQVTTDVRSGTLVIANTPGSFTTTSPMSVEVEVPTLDALRLAGSGTIAVEGTEARSLDVTLSGSGTVAGTGTVTRLDVTVSGSGTVQFTRLVANEVRAVVSGSGSIFVTATESLDASVPGSGAIHYAGNPTDVTTNITGSGAITEG